MDPTTPLAPQNPLPTTDANSTSGAAASSTGSSTEPAYKVPPIVLEKYPNLVELIKKTESMTHEEREYWFQILPIMTEEQVTRLKTILEEEAAQLAKLDDQYQSELSKLNQKHLNEWNDFQRQQDRAKAQEAEAANEAAEAQKEAEILQQLENIDPATP